MHTVPIGTEIYKIIRADPDTTNRDRNKEHKILIADLDKEGKKFLVCRGGNGGRGNFNHRDIVATEIGQKGEELEIELVLKTLADVGLVGFPNAGKSTFLASVSRAFPKIAPYPFTTIRPYVGNCKFVDGKAMTIADLPGLIEGAHANKGLGHEFLRHIERTKVILYVIDGTGDDERRPINDYKILRRELELYNPEMSNVKSLIVVNKCDRQHTSYREKFEELRQVAHTRIIPMSAKMSINIEDVILALRGLVMNETKEETLKLMSEANIDQTYL